MAHTQHDEYFAFLEREFAKGPSSQDSEPNRASTIPKKRESWQAAAQAITPRSRFGFLFGVTNKDINRARLLLEGIPAPSNFFLIAKRFIDIVGASTALILLAPVIIVLALIIKMDSPGPAFFAQDRVGLHGKHFKMLKFRTMYIDAPQSLASLADGYGAGGVLFKIKNDPRVTQCGRWIRKYSLDELPQFFNVLRGDMSLVGPRPPLVTEFKAYAEFRDSGLLVKPGITGLWAVSGRANLSMEQGFRLDVYYVENWSVVLDLLILLRTIRVGMSREGSY